MRLIDADALLKWLSEWELQEAPWWGANGYGDAKVAETIKEAIDAVEQMPTIEPKKGKWKHDADGLVWCYGCGFGKERSDERPYNYCPNCGAKMCGDIKDSELTS